MEDDTNDQPSCEPKLQDSAAIYCDGTWSKQSDCSQADWEALLDAYWYERERDYSAYCNFFFEGEKLPIVRANVNMLEISNDDKDSILDGLFC